MIKRDTFSQDRKDSKRETVFHHQNKSPFSSLLASCSQCSMGPCQIYHDNLPLHLKLLQKQKTKGICGDTIDTIIAKNLLSAIIKGTTSTLIHAEYIASYLTNQDLSNLDLPSSKIKNERKLQMIHQRLKTEDQSIKEIVLIALNDIENSTSSSMNFLAKYLPTKVCQDLVNILPKSASRELLWANHLCTIGVSSNPEEFLVQGLRLGLANLGAMIIASELQDTLLLPSQLVTSKTGLEEEFVNIVLIGHLPLLGDKIIELSTAEEMLHSARNQGARGINVSGIGCVGNELLGKRGISFVGGAYQQEFVISTGLVEVVVADFGCVYPNLQKIANSFHTKFINTQGIDGVDEKEIIQTAIKNFTNRKKTDHLNTPKKTISFSCGFSYEGCMDILTRLNAEDPIKPLLDWLVSDQIHGFALLVGCTKLNEEYIQIIKELLKKNILVLGVGCSLDSCIEAELLRDNATVENTGRELGNVLCNLSKIVNVEKTLPPVWHFGSMINFAHILKLIFAISTRLDIKIKDIPIVAIVNELGVEKPTSIGFGILSLGIPVHFGLESSVMSSNLVANVLTKKISELFEGRIILETDPLQAAKLLIGSIDEKRIGLNI